MAQEQIESLVVGYEDHASAGANAAAAAIKRVGDEAVVTEERVRRVSKSGEQLGRQYGEVERLTAKVAAVTQKFRRDLDDLEASEKDAAEKARLRANILAQQEIAIQKATTAHERWVAGMRAAEAASTAQAAGAAAATATAKSWAGAMAQVYETATTASTGVNGTARALQALNADMRSGHATFAEWAAGAKALESALRSISAAQKAINDNTGVSRSPVNTATIGDLRYATTGKGASSGTTLALVTGDAEASARRLKDLEAAFGAVDAELERYREDLGLVDVAQKRYQAGLAELEGTVRRAGLAEEEGAALLQAYAAAHDPAVAAAKRLADEEKAALARMAADWDAAVRDREATAAMIIADEQATARAAAQTAAENAKLAASYRAVMAAVDPTAAAQQRYDTALADLRAGAAAAGKSVEELAADEARLTAALSPAAQAVQKEEAALRSLVGSLDRTFGAEEKLTAQQRLLDRAMTDGVGGIRLTREQHEALSRTLREQHDIATRSATSTKLAAHESLNLSYQLQDFVVQVGSGQGLLTPLLQQAPQAVGAVGGVGRAMALLTSSTALTAMGIGSLALGFGLVLGRAITIQDELRQFNALLKATGQQAGLTAEQLHGVAEGMVGYGASREEANIVVKNLVATRKRVSEELARDIGSLSIDMGSLFGGTAEAGQRLTTWVTTGVKGLREMADETGALSLAQYEAARAAMEHGDKETALGIAIGALKDRFSGLHRDSLSPAGRAMEDLRNAYNDLVNTAAEHPVIVTVQVVGAGVLTELSKFIKDPANFEFPTVSKNTEFPNPFGWLLRQLNAKAPATLSEGALTGNVPWTADAPAGTPIPGRKPTEQNGLPLSEAIALSDLTKANDKLLVAMQKVGAERVIETARVQAEIAALNAGKSEKAAELEGAQAARMARAQLTQAVTDTNRATLAEVAGAELVARAYGASSAAVREATLHQKALAEAARGTIEPYDAIVERLRRVDDAQRTLQAAQFDQTLRDQTADAARLAEAWEEGAGAVREVTLATEVLAEARKRGLDPTRDAAEIRVLGEGVLARDAAQRAQQFGQMAEEQRRAVEAANAEYALLGQGNAARAQQIASLRAANDLRAKGADLTDAGTRAYIAQAGELARVNSLLQDAAQNAANIAQPISTAFEDVLVGAAKAGDAFKALGEDLKRIFVRQTITKPFETLVGGELTKLMAGPVAVANDNTPRAANDNGLLDRVIGTVNSGLGSSPSKPMWVQMAAGAAALDVSGMAAQAMSGPVPVAIADGGAIVDTIRAEARAQGVPEEVALAVAKIESGHRQHAADGRVLTSSAGAQGVMQLMPGTADWLGVDATNTRENIRGGVTFLSMLGRQFGGDWTMAAAAYNAGPTRAQAWQRGDAALPAETVAYIQKFTGAMREAGTQATGVTRAMEDEMAARLDAVPVQRSSTAAQVEWTAAQRATIDAALGLTAANDNTAASIEVVARPMDKLRENAISAAEAQGQAAKLNVQGAQMMAQASQQSAAMMVGGTQQAVGGILSIVGALSGIKGGGIPGQVIQAGGPQGIMSSVQQLGSAIGEWAKKPLESLGLSGAGSIMDAKLFTLPSFGSSGATAAGVAKAGNGMLAGGEGASTGLGTQAAGTGYTVGNALSSIGYGVNAFQNFKQGNVIGGIGNTAATVMSFIPGLQPFAPLVAIGSQLLGGLVGGRKPSNREGNVSIDFGTGATSVGGQEGDKYSAENRQAAQGIGAQIQQLAQTLEASLPGQQIKGRGLVAVGDRDGLRAEYAGQTASFGKEDTSGVAAWFARQFAMDLKSGFERGDVPAQVASNLQVVLDRGVTSGVERFVSDVQFAATDFSKMFDTVGKPQTDSFSENLTALSVSYQTARNRAADLGLATEGMGESFDKASKRLYDAAIRSVKGLDLADNIETLWESWRKQAIALMGAGRDVQPSLDLLGAQLSAALNAVGDDIPALEKLISAAATLRQMGNEVGAVWAETRADQVRSVVMESLDMRKMAAEVELGRVSQQEYDRRALEIQQRQELAAVTDATVRQQLAQVQALEAQAKAEAALAEQRKAQIAAGGSVRGWLDQQRSTAGTSVSPQEARDAAQAQFARDLALARGGDVDAYGRLTGAADRLLSSQEALTASGTETQAMRAWVMSSLENLPATKSYDQQMLEELQKLGGSVNVQVELTTVRIIAEQLSALSDADKAKLTQTAVLLRTVEERMGRFLTDAEVASLVTAGIIERSIEQELGRDLTAAERAAMVPGGEILRLIEQTMGRDLTAAELDGIVTGGSVIRSVEQSLGRSLTAAEQAAIILPGSVQRTIGQQIDPATGATLVPGGSVTRTVTQSVETTETVQISRAIDDKISTMLFAQMALLTGQTRYLAAIAYNTQQLAPHGIGISADTEQFSNLRAIANYYLKSKLQPLLTADGLDNYYHDGSVNMFQNGGVVPGYETGGIVANGIPGRDSVIARGPGGMPIWLAGLEGILTASATAAIGGKPTIDYINQHHALPGWERVGYEAGGIAPPANDLWSPAVTPIRRQDYAPAAGRSGSDDRAVAELRLLRQAIERLERRLERNEGMDQEQRAAIAQELARLLDRVADATEDTAKKLTGTGGF